MAVTIPAYITAPTREKPPVARTLRAVSRSASAIGAAAFVSFEKTDHFFSCMSVLFKPPPVK
jgi:hypothetical protein